MCWKSKTEPIKMVADKDIHVFKIANSPCTSLGVFPYFYNFNEICYKEGETYFQRMAANEPYYGLFKEYIINLGFHSYALNNIRLMGARSREIPLVATCAKKATSMHTSQKYNIYGLAIMLCVIPKGATYYVNSVGEIVSNKLKVERILKCPFEANKNGETSERSVEKVNKILDEWEN